MAETLAKTKIVLDFSDVDAADKSLVKVSKDVVGMGNAAKKAAPGIDKASKSVADLSEQFDKKLEKSLGRSFKATDRINSIIGQFGAVGAIAGVAVAGLTAAYGFLTSASREAAESQARLNKMLAEDAVAAQVAAKSAAESTAGAYRDLAKAAGVAAAAVTFGESQAARAASAELIRANAAVDAATVKGALQAAEISKQRGLLQKEEAKNLQGASQQLIDRNRFRRDQIRLSILGLEASRASTKVRFDTAQEDASQAQASIKAMTAELAKLSFATGTAKKATGGGKPRASADAADLLVSPAEEAAFRASLAWDVFWIGLKEDGERAALESRDWLGALAENPALAEANSELSKMLELLKDMPTELSAAQKSTIAFSNAFSDNLTPQIEMMGEAMLSSAFDAAVYGDSFKDQLNDFAEAQAKTAAISAAMELAKGLAMSFINPAQAAAHFGAAAAFGVAAGVATVAAHSTGGFNGPTAEETEDDEPAFTGSGEVARDRSQDGGATTTEVNVNLFAGARPLLRIETAAMAQELRGIIGSR